MPRVHSILDSFHQFEEYIVSFIFLCGLATCRSYIYVRIWFTISHSRVIFWGGFHMIFLMSDNWMCFKICTLTSPDTPSVYRLRFLHCQLSPAPEVPTSIFVISRQRGGVGQGGKQKWRTGEGVIGGSAARVSTLREIVRGGGSGG